MPHDAVPTTAQLGSGGGDNSEFSQLSLDMYIASRSSILAFTALLGAAPVPRADEVRCAYVRRAVCGPQNCTTIPVSSNYLLVPSLRDLREAMTAERPVQVRRCDAKGCGPVDVVVVQAGDYFMNLVGPTASFLMRIAVADEPVTGLRTGEFSETAYLLRTSYMGFGRCQA